MFKTFKKLFKKLFKKEEFFKEQVEIIDVLLYAKHFYILRIKENNPDSFPGMCYCIHVALQYYTNAQIPYSDLIHYIPEFNVNFLKGNSESAYWWPTKDIESRIKAFDKLIKIYE